MVKREILKSGVYFDISANNNSLRLFGFPNIIFLSREDTAINLGDLEVTDWERYISGEPISLGAFITE